MRFEERAAPHRYADRLPTKSIHVVAALIFIVFGVLALKNALSGAPLKL